MLQDLDKFTTPPVLYERKPRNLKDLSDDAFPFYRMLHKNRLLVVYICIKVKYKI